MSKYIAALPLSRVERIAIVVTRGTKTLAQVAAEARSAHPDCEVYVLNGGVYYGAKAVMHLRSDGYTYAEDPYSYWGYAWDVGPDIAMGLVPCGKANYINCVELIRQGTPNPKPRYNPDMGGTRGRTAMGIKDGYLMLYVSGDGTADAKSPEKLRNELAGLGWESAVMLDGGGSSQCDFQGQKITSSRRVHNYIAVYLKKDGEKPVNRRYTVCLDPGHGVESPGKCSPDKTYYEHEFALDMGKRLRTHLERCGVRVVMTREDEHCPTGRADDADLSKRAGGLHQRGPHDGQAQCCGHGPYQTVPRRRNQAAGDRAAARAVGGADPDQRPGLPDRVRLSHRPGRGGAAEERRLPGQAGRGHREGRL